MTSTISVRKQVDKPYCTDTYEVQLTNGLHMKKDNHIHILGARERNLKNVSLSIPRDRLVVIAGLSGSGKSSLVFDTIHQEGQRRFLESLSSYARQFLGQMKRPNVDSVEGLSPTLCIDQKTVNRNPRSTVGTITEISGYLRLLLARLGTPYCPKCSEALIAQSPLQIAKSLLELHPNKRIQLFSPIVLDRKGEYRKELLQARRDGYTYARIDGNLHNLAEDVELARFEKHRIELRIDRTKLEDKNLRRLQKSIEKALLLSNGLLSYTIQDEYHLVSSKRSCPKHGHTAPELEPRLFSFNDPQGQCKKCLGLGFVETFDFDAMFEPTIPIQTGFIPFGEDNRLPFSHLDQTMWPGLLKHLQIDGSKSWDTLSTQERQTLLKGKAGTYQFRGSDGRLRSKSRWTGLHSVCRNVLKYAPNTRLSKYRSKEVCSTCDGKRLNPVALAVQFQNRNIHDFSSDDIQNLYDFFRNIELSENQQLVGGPIIRQLLHRLSYLVQVGLTYLSLDRSAVTLSGGESQRIRLAAQVGSGLQGVTYILDEPSIGLHHRDQLKLLSVLENLRDQGNTVLVVEHDPLTMSKADHCIEVGPSAGIGGGEVVASMSRKRFVQGKSLTAQYLRGDKGLQPPQKRRELTFPGIHIKKASGNNLKELSVNIPLGGMVVVTGVSGSGKSTLIQDTLCAVLEAHFHNAETNPLPHVGIDGVEQLDKIISIDQKPIGRSSRSNPATYTKVWDDIRKLFSQSIEAKRRGYKPGRFSFNVDPSRGGGRCEDCDGAGWKTIEMQFLENVEVECESCEGRRFNDETLQIRYNGKNIHEVLELSIEEALSFFQNQPRIKRILEVLCDIGLGYIKLGQPSTTLSGGEAQRIKLGTELRRRGKGHTLYVLDEPSTGLHMADVERLVHAFDSLIEKGHSIIVIEHDLDIIKMADHIIDLGPNGGVDGGQIVGEGTPEHIATLNTETGKALQSVLNASNRSHLAPRLQADYTRKVKHRNIQVRNALTHNLKNLSATIPKGQMTVITGPSGSGKSSLAFHTVFAEGQLRYIESLSTYARRFLGRMQRPPVEEITGLAPAIAIDQSNRGRSSRSTVATSTEIYDILRILFARIGKPHCSVCAMDLTAHSPTKAAITLKAIDTKGLLLAKYPQSIRVEHLLHDGIVRIWQKEEQVKLTSLKEGTILEKPTLIIDRFTPANVSKVRLATGIELAYSYGQDIAYFQPLDSSPAIEFTRDHLCVTHNKKVPDTLSPRLFSFNTKLGACTHCDGLGKSQTVQWNKLFLEQDKGYWEAMHGWATIPFKQSRRFLKGLTKLFKHHAVSLKTPVKDYPNTFRQALMYGSTKVAEWEGMVPRINRWSADTSWLRDVETCHFCQGKRLNPDALAITIHGQSISDCCEWTVEEAHSFWTTCTWTPTEQTVVEQPLKEIVSRLQFLQEVGLEYLTLNRITHTLSGGESQRIRLASQLGSNLTRTIYVLDEPTIGLHPHNTAQLLQTLDRLKSYNNTLLLVEHDQQVIEHADHILELGPGAGEWGGELVQSGPVESIKSGDSLTGLYLSEQKKVYTPSSPRESDEYLVCPPVSLHNLKDVSLSIPKGCLSVVTGVSGSGKSTLVLEGFCRHFESLLLMDKAPIEKLTIIDQRPISRSPRSTTASYTGLLDKIRDVFTKVVLAKERGYTKGHFSYNVEKGRCSHCEGKGATLIEMHFISDIWVPCPICDGSRFDEAILEVKWNGKNIADVLYFTVDEAQAFFTNHKAIQSRLKALQQVGLGYIRLGQPNSELSGGELQRLKLATELARGSRAKDTLFVLDEPTTGLHMDDVSTLLKALDHLLENGHTVLVIEHNVDVWKAADFLVEMGPGAGSKGGAVVFSGTPQKLRTHPAPTKSQQFLLADGCVSS